MPYANIDDQRKQRREYGAVWKKRNQAKQREIVMRYRNANPEKQLFWSARGRARKKNLPFEITIEDIVIPKVCPILGIPLLINVGANRPPRNTPNSPSLDRIILSRGYVRGNIQVISWRANSLKKDGTLEEFQALVRHMEKMSE